MAQIKWIHTSGGDFATAGDWSTGTVPGPTDDALLTAVGTYTVTSEQNETVNSLQMISTVTFDINGGTFHMTNGSGSGTDDGLIAINGNNTLVLGGTLAGSGTVQLNTNGYNADLILSSATTTLSGGGKIVLSDAGANRIYSSAAGYVLNNVSDTISGSGQIGVDQTGLNNHTGGVIDATGSGTALFLDFGANTAINAGLIEATGTAGLQIQNSTITNTGGTIKAVGGGRFVNLSNVTINGGTLATTGGGVIQSVNNATLSGLTIAAGSIVQDYANSTLDLANTITNLGTIELNTNGYNADLVAASNVTLTGGGTILMSDGGPNRIYGATTNTKITNVNNKIIGSGQIGLGQLAFDNQAAGVIDATGVSAGLTIQANSFTNEGLIEDTNTAGLGIDATTIANKGTILATGAGSSVNLYNNASIAGGKLVTSHGGVIETVGGEQAMLDGSTATGAVTITAGSNVAINNNSTLSLAGSIVNDGTIAMNADGYDDDMIINSATVTLTGGGQVVLNDIGSNRIYGAAATNLLVNVDNTISGSGQIGAVQGSFDNQAAGVIDATGTQAGLTINATSFTNEGLIEDTGPAGLGIAATTIVNTGTIAAIGTGATTNIYNSSIIEGGTLFSSGGGYLETSNTGTLDGAAHGAITIAGGSNFDINGNTTLDLVGTIINHGTIAMNADGYSNDLIANSAKVTLTGGGTIAMNDVGSNRIYGAMASNLLINVNNTIIGSGQIGAFQGSFDNQAAGVIDATGTSAGLTIAATAFSNEGLVEDTGPAGLGIDATVLLNSGTIAAIGAGATVNLYNSGTIAGGTLTSSGGGFFETTNTGTLDGTTNGALTISAASLFDINGNTTLDLVGSIVNHGTIAMNADGYNNDLIIASPVVTLSGGGSVVLNDVGSNRIYGAATADKLVNAGNTISGSGQFGVGQLTLDNQKAGVIDATGTGTNLNIDLGSTFANEGLVEASGPAGLVIQNATLTNTGTIASLSGSNVTITSTTAITNFNAGTLSGGTWEAISAGGTATSTLSLASGPITVDAAHLVISGAGASIVAGGTSVVTSLTSISPTGELDVQNGATFASANTLTDSGKILLSGSLSAPAITTTGAGSITANGGTATLTTTAKLTNNGTLQATSGGTLIVAGGTLVNAGSIIAQAGGVVSVLSAEHDTNLVGGTLSGGTWAAIGNHATLALSGLVTTDAATITLSAAGSVFKSGIGTALEATLTTIAAGAQLNVLNARGFASTVAGGIADSGTIALGDGTFSAAGLTIAAGGTFLGGGTLASAVIDNGSLLSSAAPAGSTAALTVTGAISGTGLLSAGAATALIASGGFAVGTLSVGSGGTLTGSGSVRGAVTLGGTLLDGTGTLSAGSITVQPSGLLSGKTITATGAIADNGTIVLGGGTLSGGSISAGNARSLLQGYGKVSQSVANTGTIDAQGGTLTLAAGETGGTLSAEAGATLAASAPVAATSLTIAAGGSFIGTGAISGATTDRGALTAAGGKLTLDTSRGSGAAFISTGSTLDCVASLRIASLSFAAGSNETLQLGTAAGDTAVIAGFAAGTTIDLLNTVVTSFGYAAGAGKLSLRDGSATVGTLKFAGSYSHGSFNLVSDGHGGTDIVFTGKATADLQAAVTGNSGTVQAAGLALTAPAERPAAARPSGSAGFSMAQVHPVDGLVLHVAVH